MKQIVTTSLLLWAYISYAITYMAVSDRDWSNASTWSFLRIPNLSSWPGDEVIIVHSIFYSDN